jgi:hypothetical protein
MMHRCEHLINLAVIERNHEKLEDAPREWSVAKALFVVVLGD